MAKAAVRNGPVELSVAGVVFAGLSFIALSSVLTPVLGWTIFTFLFRRTFPPAKQPSVDALALQAGYLVWLLTAVFWVPNGLGRVWVDVVVLAVGLLWLFLSQGAVAAGCLIAAQTLALIINLITLSQADWSAALPGAILVHVAIRVFSIALMIRFIVERTRRLRVDPAAVFD